MHLSLEVFIATAGLTQMAPSSAVTNGALGWRADWVREQRPPPETLCAAGQSVEHEDACDI